MADLVTTAGVEPWAGELDAVANRLAPLVARSQPRRHVADHLRASPGDAERKNAWRAAEYVGDDSPYAFQHPLGRADWDADLARDLPRGHVAETLDDPTGGLVHDEAGFRQNGRKSAGGPRQYPGTAGRIEACQVGVLLAFTGRHGRALVARELYRPEQWAADPQRREEAGTPAAVAFATQPGLGRRLPRRYGAAGLRAKGVTADEAYGNDGTCRRLLGGSGQPYVLAVQSNQRLWLGLAPARVDQTADGIGPGRAGRGPPAGGDPSAAGNQGERIELRVPEVRWLVGWRTRPRQTTAQGVLAWSAWRRAHPAHARACHYRKRGADPP